MIEQGTPEWRALRCGKVTASRVADIMRKVKGGGASKSRESYLGELVAERLTGVQEDGFCSGDMQWGKDTEDEARAVYEFMRNVTIERVAFVDHAVIEHSGSSPDALIAADGGAEFKCPKIHTHIAYLITEIIDPDYIKQIQWNMACTGRQWWDFVSYQPKLPADMQMWTKRIARDDVMIAELEKETRVFLAEVAATVDALVTKYRNQIAAE
jgi:hypothetical protein